MQLGKSSLLLWSNEEMTIFLFHPRGRSCPQMPQNEVVFAPGPMRWPYQADLPLHGGLKFRESVVDSLPSHASLNLKKEKITNFGNFSYYFCHWVSWCAINHTHLYHFVYLLMHYFFQFCSTMPYASLLPPQYGCHEKSKIREQLQGMYIKSV